MSPIDNSWHPFFLFLVTHFMKDGITEDEAKSRARHYNFWESLGFNYGDLKRDFEKKVHPLKNCGENNKYINNLWEYLNERRNILTKNVSVSTGINLGMVQN
jgi:hypothetical protein